MSLIQATILAVIQAWTEFLPISSSAHLILAPRFLGWPDQGLPFDIAANTGTLLAVLIYFRAELARLTRDWLASLRRGEPHAPQALLAWWLVIGTIPAGIAGLLLHDFVAHQARNPALICATMIGYGLLLGWADRTGTGNRGLAGLGWRDAWIIGGAQALSLIPGTSRSGITITAALFLGLDRTSAARFSFLLSAPVGVLVAIKDLIDMARGAVPASSWAPMGVVVAVGAAAGYLVIDLLLAWVRRWSLTVFVVYRLLLGLLIYWVLIR